MIDVEIKSWEQFVELADGFDIGGPGELIYGFRGQSNKDWELKPSILRMLEDKKRMEAEGLQIEDLALNEFTAQAHLHITPNVLSTTNDLLGWWMLMQHHGAPTRLLDWCQSIFVATYFAITENLKVDGAVWVVHIPKVHSLMMEKYNVASIPKHANDINKMFKQQGAAPVLQFVKRLKKTERMISQQGFFSVCQNILGNHGAILSETIPTTPDNAYFVKIVIPAKLKSKFLKKLKILNISANSLFPGLDGLARSIGEFIQIYKI